MTAWWDGRDLHLWPQAGAGTVIAGIEGEGKTVELPPPGNATPQRLLLPLESLLLRPFSLPLSHPRFLDREMLAQELVEQAGIEPEAWRLCWHATACEGGVRGLVFALPLELSRRLETEPGWQACREVGVDAWFRLQAMLPPQPPPDFTVLDADADGLFLGVRRGSIWYGMRRLNRTASRSIPELAEDARRSLAAMGLAADNEPAFGRLDAAWLAAFVPALDWHGETVAKLPPRAAATREASRMAARQLFPNFGNGTGPMEEWRRHLKPWKRTAFLAALLVLAQIGYTLHRLHSLEEAQARLQAGIAAAFHRGLPRERVMLDPLAQLRKAAGETAGGDAWNFLRMLRAVGRLKEKMAGLHVTAVRYDGGKMRLSATAADLAAVKRARDLLATILGVEVRLEDTQLQRGRVRFRLAWS